MVNPPPTAPEPLVSEIGSAFPDRNTALIPPVHGRSSAGGVTELIGAVRLAGKPKPEIVIRMDAVCGELNPEPVTTRHFVVSKSGGLANVLVYLRDAQKVRPAEPGPVLDQVACLFEPYVMGLIAGQTFFVRNSDPVFHNVNVMAKFNRQRNLGQPLQGDIASFSFDKPEVFIRIKCDVHPWMFAYIGVIDHPYFAVTDTNGLFRLPPGFSHGTYTVVARHVKAGELVQKVTIGSGEQKAVQFEFTAGELAGAQAQVSSAGDY